MCTCEKGRDIVSRLPSRKATACSSSLALMLLKFPFLQRVNMQMLPINKKKVTKEWSRTKLWCQGSPLLAQSEKGAYILLCLAASSALCCNTASSLTLISCLLAIGCAVTQLTLTSFEKWSLLGHFWDAFQSLVWGAYQHNWLCKLVQAHRKSVWTCTKAIQCTETFVLKLAKMSGSTPSPLQYRHTPYVVTPKLNRSATVLRSSHFINVNHQTSSGYARSQGSNLPQPSRSIKWKETLQSRVQLSSS